MQAAAQTSIPTNILFLAFEFPPRNAAGVYRSLAFAKYLPQFGINPIILTLDPDNYADLYQSFSIDTELGKEVLENRSVYRIKTTYKKKRNRLGQFYEVFFSIHGNETKLWEQNVFAILDQIVDKHKPSAIYATLPPFGSLPLALKIARKYNLALIYDFRDAWSQWTMTPYGTYGHYIRTLQLEKKYLKSADAVLATSKQIFEDFKRLYPSINEGKYHYIPNGYEGELKKWKGIDGNKDEILIGYVGSFYYSTAGRADMMKKWWQRRGHRMLQYLPVKQDWLYKTPYFFFKALADLVKTNPDVAAKIKVQFAGKKEEWLDEMIREFELESYVEHIGELTHKQSLEFQEKCDILLLTSAKYIDGRKDYMIALKTFEYFQQQKPVLAFVNEGALKDILIESGMALICNPDDSKGSAGKILSLLNGKVELRPELEFINELSRDKQAKQLAEIITNTIKERSAGLSR